MLKFVKDKLGFGDHLKYFEVLHLLFFRVRYFRLTSYVYRNFFLYMLLNQRLVRFNLVIDFVSYLLLQFVLCFGEVQVIVGDYLGSSLDFHYRFISLDIKME
jgi:hypothetical protein